MYVVLFAACPGEPTGPGSNLSVTTEKLSETTGELSETTSEATTCTPFTTHDSGTGMTGVTEATAPVPCVDNMCESGDLCVVPARVCSCGQEDPGDPPFCVPVPNILCGAPFSIAECLGDVLCGHRACFGHRLADGVLECGIEYCHCE